MVGRGNGIVRRGTAERLVDERRVSESDNDGSEEELGQIHVESA